MVFGMTKTCVQMLYLLNSCVTLDKLYLTSPQLLHLENGIDYRTLFICKMGLIIVSYSSSYFKDEILHGES